MSSLPQLYQPTAAEITHVVESAKLRHPICSSRLDKACEILRNGGLQLDSVAWEVRQMARWKIASQSGNGAYVVVNCHCPCQDKAAPVVERIHFCKHALAVALYNKILRNKVNADIRLFNVELGVMGDGTFHGYAVKAGFMRLFKDGATYRFSDPTSAVYYSLWLANRATNMVTLPSAELAVAA